MDGQTNWIHAMGAGILFFLFLLLFSPNAKAMTKENSALLLKNAVEQAQDELKTVQVEQARRIQKQRASDELALDFTKSTTEVKLPQQPPVAQVVGSSPQPL
jgi:hypothetical protein